MLPADFGVQRGLTFLTKLLSASLRRMSADDAQDAADEVPGPRPPMWSMKRTHGIEGLTKRSQD